MRFFHLLLLVFPMLFGAANTGAKPTESETLAKLSSIKERLPFLCFNDFLYDRSREKDRLPEIRSAWSVLEELKSEDLTESELLKASESDDPDIKVLALLALVARESKSFIPVAIKIMSDDRKVIPRQVDVSDIIESTKVYTEDFTASSAAWSVLKLIDYDGPYPQITPNRPPEFRFPGRADIPEPEKKSAPLPGEEWWELRKNDDDWLGWYQFRYARASKGTSPVQTDAQSALERFRRDLDLMEPVTRAWVLLYLADDIFISDGKWKDRYASEEEMIAATQSLGPDALLEFLKTGNRRGLKNPSLDQGTDGRRFILHYASDFFSRNHAADLIDLNHFHAAADVDPERVREIASLSREYFQKEHLIRERFEMRGILAALGDADDRKAAVDWFYREDADTDPSGSYRSFIEAVEKRKPAQWQDLFKKIVANSKFDQLHPYALRSLVNAFETCSGETLVEDKTRYDTEEDADRIRNSFRERFQVRAQTFPLLANPDHILTDPVWKIEIEGDAGSLALSPNGKTLSLGLNKEREGLLLIESETGAEKKRIRVDGEQIKVSYTHDSNSLIFSSYSPNRIYLLENSDDVPSLLPFETREEILPAPSTEHFLTHTTDALTLVDLPTGKMAWTAKYNDRSSSAIAFSSNSEWIAKGNNWVREISLFNTSDGSVHSILSGHATCPDYFSFSNDSKFLLSTAEDHRIMIWNIESGVARSRYQLWKRSGSAVAFSHDDEFFFATVDSNILGCFSVDRGEAMYGIPFKGNWIQSIIPSRDGSRVYFMTRAYLRNTPTREATTYLECWRLPQ